jgi:hypothetical protein
VTDTIGIGAARPVGSGTAVSRRDLLSLIGTVAGSAAMYHVMSSLGFASGSGYKGPIALGGDVRGASVLILGAGLAGMTAALELRNAGYKVSRAGPHPLRSAATEGRWGCGVSPVPKGGTRLVGPRVRP